MAITYVLLETISCLFFGVCCLSFVCLFVKKKYSIGGFAEIETPKR